VREPGDLGARTRIEDPCGPVVTGGGQKRTVVIEVRAPDGVVVLQDHDLAPVLGVVDLAGVAVAGQRHASAIGGEADVNCPGRPIDLAYHRQVGGIHHSNFSTDDAAVRYPAAVFAEAQRSDLSREDAFGGHGQRVYLAADQVYEQGAGLRPDGQIAPVRAVRQCLTGVRQVQSGRLLVAERVDDRDHLGVVRQGDLPAVGIDGYGIDGDFAFVLQAHCLLVTRYGFGGKVDVHRAPADDDVQAVLDRLGERVVIRRAVEEFFVTVFCVIGAYRSLLTS
jgi:hypothetical protein